MLWFLILIFIIAIIFSYLLFAPFYFEINSITGLCGIRFHHLASAGLIFTDDSLKIDIRIAGWNKQTYWPAITEGKKEKPVIIKKKKKPLKISFSMVKAILNSFKVNKCYLTIDSGNMQLNGILYPFFYWISKRTHKTIEINFLDKNEIILEIENNFARILKAFIFHQFIYKNKNHGQLK